MHPTTGKHLFIGGRDRGLNWLQWLTAQGQPPAAVYCLQEDDHETDKFSPQIVRLCAEAGVPCKTRKRLTQEDEQEIVGAAADLIVVMGWRTIVSERVLSAARYGAVGVHESLLPSYRGFAPVNWAVINGEQETGVSLFYLTFTGVDNGDIVAQARVPIGEADTAYAVYQRTSQASLAMLQEHLAGLLAGSAPRVPQDESKATYTCSRTPDDGLIDWGADTRAVHNLVRGLAHPYPGAFTYHQGKLYRIWSGRPVQNTRAYVGRIPGRIVGVTADGVEVLTRDGIYLIETAGEDDATTVVPAQALFRSVRSGFATR